MRMKKIMKSLEELMICSNPNDQVEFIEGDDTEFGEPDKLCLKKGSQVLELNYKVGNSWYFDNASGVRIFTVGVRKESGVRLTGLKLRLIDTLFDDDIVKDWFTDYVVNKKYDSDINDVRTKAMLLKNQYSKAKHKGKVICPNYVYIVPDPDTDELKNYCVVDIGLPGLSDENRRYSLIATVGKDDTSYRLRALSTGDSPSLIELKEIKDKNQINEYLNM